FGSGSRRRNQRVDASLNFCQLLRNPILESSSFHGGLYVDETVGKPELSYVVLRQIALHFLNGAMQIVPEIFLEQVEQRFNLRGLECRRLAAVQHVDDAVGAQEREVVPVFEFGVDPVWN